MFKLISLITYEYKEISIPWELGKWTRYFITKLFYLSLDVLIGSKGFRGFILIRFPSWEIDYEIPSLEVIINSCWKTT